MKRYITIGIAVSIAFLLLFLFFFYKKKNGNAKINHIDSKEENIVQKKITKKDSLEKNNNLRFIREIQKNKNQSKGKLKENEEK